MRKPSKKRRGYYILRASKRNKDGTISYARDYGKKAFKIWIAL